MKAKNKYKIGGIGVYKKGFEYLLLLTIPDKKGIIGIEHYKKILIMKTGSITIRVSGEDKKLIQKAAVKFHKETGAKVSISATIIHLVKQYYLSS
ncbi:MAG TPA: hypothetical protein VMV77_21965 [Bacteroidales bacterium]|nr:hypothetical protein [Bacteroidales bacterium]